MTDAQITTQINADIRNKTGESSVTRANVADALQAVVENKTNSADFAAALAGALEKYIVPLTQTTNAIYFPAKGNKIELQPIVFVGGAVSAKYTLYKTVAGIPTAGTERTTLNDINADIAAMTNTEINNSYQVLIVCTFTPGAETGAVLLSIVNL